MKTIMAALAAFLFAAALIHPAEARMRRHAQAVTVQTFCGDRYCNVRLAKREPAGATRSRKKDVSAPMGWISRSAAGADPRPRAWCGWWLRQELGIADRSLNLARNWSRYGSNAGGPDIGVIVVWRHHVGIITAATPTGWVVKSGNDGHAIRERERSLRGAIAFRRPNGVASR